MGKILNAEEGEHLVTGYSFKSLNFGDEADDNIEEVTTPIQAEQKLNTQNGNNVPTEVISHSNNSHHLEMIEKLLERSDSFSGAIERLEQQLQTQAQTYDQKFAEIKESSYKLGFSEGYNQAKKELEDKIKEHLSKLIESVHKIEDVYKDYQTKAENIEKELVGVAVDIAEEVVAKELTKSSKEIALNLTKELINDIKEATKIEVRVNPLDYDYIKENINLEKVEVSPDNAISAGGVVILSDAGNIEAEIHERFKAIKTHILKG